MEKYTGAKTIGDGTYGSVLKAINKQNGKSHRNWSVFPLLNLAFLFQARSLQSKKWRRSTIGGTNA